MCLLAHFKYTMCQHEDAPQRRYCQYRSECGPPDLTKSIELKWEGNCLGCDLSTPLPVSMRLAFQGIIVYSRLEKHMKKHRIGGQYHLDTKDSQALRDLPDNHVDSARTVQEQFIASLRIRFRNGIGVERRSTKDMRDLVSQIRNAIQRSAIDHLAKRPTELSSEILRAIVLKFRNQPPLPQEFRLHIFRKSMIPVDLESLRYDSNGQRIAIEPECPLCFEEYGIPNLDNRIEYPARLRCPCNLVVGRLCLEDNLLRGRSECAACQTSLRPLRNSDKASNSGPKPWWLAMLHGEAYEGVSKETERV